jgi:hypothetical protein
MKPRVIAFYLPQFYPTPENDEWWEPGFTEWTNVTRTKPLFKGHYQPRLPRDLGFYDLRVPETREKQAELARYAGIEGFCYWHYWFAGRRMLDIPFREVVESGKPDFPFCLCWANHSWKAKTWTPNAPDKMLIEQTYPGEGDYINHFNAMLPAFKDKRYMKVDGKLIFGIFNPHEFKDFTTFKNVWNQMAQKNGLAGFYFFAFVQYNCNIEKFNTDVYDSIVRDTIIDGYGGVMSSKMRALIRGIYYRFHRAYAIDYSEYVDVSLKVFRDNPDYIPCIAPGFDHSPRSGWKWIILKNSTPDKWKYLCEKVSEQVLSGKNIVFIKAWNEWGEGNYLEPDQKYGDGFVQSCRNVFVDL